MYQLIHADCMDVLRAMPEKSVDCIVTDPPYLIGAGDSGFSGTQYLRDIKAAGINKGFDATLLAHCLRITKVPNFVFFASRLQLRDYLNWAHEHDLRWSLICWHKTNPVPLTSGSYLPDTEYALHFRRGKRAGGNYQSKRQYYVQPSGKSPYAHPTVKPLNIVKNLVLNAATARGQLVLDPFMGTGTTGVAAIQLGHRFVGIEKNGDYLAIARRRLSVASPDFDLAIAGQPEEARHEVSRHR